MLTKHVDARRLSRKKEKSSMPGFVVEIIDSIQRSHKFAKFRGLFSAFPPATAARSINDQSRIRSSSFDIWTTLAKSSGAYFRRFRWRSGLGVAFALYLVVTFAFSGISVDGEHESFDEDLHSISRELLMVASYTFTFLLIRMPNNHIVVKRSGEFGDSITLPMSDLGKTRCTEAVDQFMDSKGITYSTDDGKESRTVSGTYWTGPNEPGGDDSLYQMCTMDADLIIDKSSDFETRSLTQDISNMVEFSQRALNTMFPDSNRKDTVNHVKWKPAVVTYLVFHAYGSVLIQKDRANLAQWVIPFRSQVGKAKCKEAFDEFIEDYKSRGMEMSRKTYKIRTSEWNSNQICEFQMESAAEIPTAKSTEIRVDNAHTLRGDNSNVLLDSDKRLLNYLFSDPATFESQSTGRSGRVRITSMTVLAISAMVVALGACCVIIIFYVFYVMVRRDSRATEAVEGVTEEPNQSEEEIETEPPIADMV